MDEVEESMERVIAGPQRKGRVMTEAERTTIAYHESGHALVGHILEHSDPVHKISIVSRGQALGYTLQLPQEDHFLKTKNEMLDELAVFLGGRVAEELMCDDITSGASNDLERATKMAREMVTRLGMSEELGTQVFGEAQHQCSLVAITPIIRITPRRRRVASISRFSALCVRPIVVRSRSWTPSRSARSDGEGAA